jgi:hypothetical protein
MIKTFSEFTEAEQKIICEKNKEYMVYDDWYYDVARDMDEFDVFDDYVLDWVGHDDTCGQLAVVEFYAEEKPDITWINEKLNKEVHEYYDYLTSPEYVAEGLADNNELIDTETYKVVGE